MRVVVDLDGGGGEDILDAHLRHFFIRYADRILFGADAGPDLADYQLYYRFLETDDEYFNYNGGAVPRQGRWGAYGLYLPDDVLEKVYWRNAARLLRVA